MISDKAILELAKKISDFSPDTSTKIGVVIVNDEDIISFGFNAPIVKLKDYMLKRPEKYFWFEHAERNAIFKAIRGGESLEGSTLYLSNWLPCADCARAIIGVGIKKIVTTNITVPDRWADSVSRGLDMFQEHGVNVFEVGIE